MLVAHPDASNNAVDPAPGYAELHCASAFSFLRAGSSVEALVVQAASLGLTALALTDFMTLAGVVRFQTACAAHGLHGVVGTELAVADPVFGDTAQPAHLVVLAENAVGYARLCALLTEANLADPGAPVIPFADLAAQPDDLILLTGGRDGTLARLLLARQHDAAAVVARHYAAAFGRERVFVELQHQRLPDSVGLMQQMVWLAEATRLRYVATNSVRYATREDYPLYDLLTCVRLGITVDEAHRERPRNDEAHLKSGSELASLFGLLPWGPSALAASGEIAARCDLSLLKGVCTAPQVALPEGETPESQLRRLCMDGLRTGYAAAPAALADSSPQRRQLAHELGVITQLDLAEFFLCVQGIVSAARQMGIRVSGRGSAANSLVAYLLGITGVDPIEHGLLFERFLTPDRRSMPDIDLDVQSDRREELIRYVERTYTHAHTAMVANVITYRPRLALRDAAKSLGYPLDLVNRLTKALPHHHDPEELGAMCDELARIITTFVPDTTLRARCLARLPMVLGLAARLCGLPRHLSLHNGGMVLTREPLAHLLPVRVSANGVRALEVDKDDVERLGLIKFDLLGLRTLGAIEETLALIEETTCQRPDIDHLPTQPPDLATMRLIRSGQTLAVFQIESPGQWHLLAQTQPQTFDDLIVQTALFRPGPIIGGFVHPYVEQRQARQRQTEQVARGRAAQANCPAEHVQHGQRRQQREAVQTPWQTPDGAPPAATIWTTHPVLHAILQDTEGILLFQEQILEIAHQFAGLSYAEADGFRRAMSHARTQREMEAMRARFVAGALARSETEADATRVFEAISHFVGYGFCKSHAAEFARTIYQTAWLKAHYPAHYLAGFLSSQPAGFFPPHVVLEEAKRLGIPVLGVDINRSEDRFSVERVGQSYTPRGTSGRWAIRIGLRQIAQVGEELARTILWERRGTSDIAPDALAADTADGAVSHAAPHAIHDAPRHERQFTSLQETLQRLRPAGLTWQAAEALILAGACDGLRPRMTRRQRLWQAHELWPLVAPTRTTKHLRNSGAQRQGRRKQGGSHWDRPEQLPLTWEMGLDEDAALLSVQWEAVSHPPHLPTFTREEVSALDYQLLGMSARPHPLSLLRRPLRRRGVRAIADLLAAPEGQIVRVAGWPISAQRPPTANGMGFLVLEDETGRLPVALPPRLATQMRRLIASSRVVIVVGRVERRRWYRSLFAVELRGENT